MTPNGRTLISFAILLLVTPPVVSCSHSPVAGLPGAGKGAAPGLDARATVRVTFREEPAAGVRVSWLSSLEEGAAPAAVAETDGGGRAAFVLPPGKYFLVARWCRDGDSGRPVAPGDRFAWFGGNPAFLVPGQTAEFFVALEEFPEPPVGGAAPQGAGGVSGSVIADGRPLADAYVLAYLRLDGGFRDPGFAASAPTADDGSFVLDLPPGRYYLVVRKRAGGGVAGPMRKGDHFGYYAGNPVSVTSGAMVSVVIPATRLKLRNAPVYSGGYKAAAFIEGRIVGRDGKPRKGVYAALYDNPELLNRPAFLSDVTGEDGKYRLPVPVPGKYYLGARTGYGGSPAPGDLYGRYEGNPEHSVAVKEGETLAGLDIVVDEVW